jgi:hypothetical protein
MGRRYTSGWHVGKHFRLTAVATACRPDDCLTFRHVRQQASETADMPASVPAVWQDNLLASQQVSRPADHPAGKQFYGKTFLWLRHREDVCANHSCN